MQLALRLRPGLQPSADLPHACICGRDMVSDPNHFLSCPILRSTAATLRHNIVLQRFASHARNSGAVLEIEPHYENSSRPDGKIYLPDESIDFDISLTHPDAPSLTRHSQVQLGAASQRANRKHQLYDAQARNEGSDGSIRDGNSWCNS